MLRRRRAAGRSRLWPSCLRSAAARDDQDTYTAASAAPASPSSADNDAVKMADITSPTPETPPDVVGGDGLFTIQMSGGAPFGFRLSDDGQGRLVVGKVCVSCTRLYR